MDFSPGTEHFTFFLNPYSEHRFHHCPRCGEETHKRNRVLIVQAEPAFMAPVMASCRYCANCDLLIGHQDEIEATLRHMLPPEEQDFLDGPLSVIGTLDRARLGLGGLEEATPDELFQAFRPIGGLSHFELARDETGALEWIEVAQPYPESLGEIPVPEISEVQTLPQADETWQVAVRRLQTWVADEEGQPFRPYMTMVVSVSGPLVIFQDMFDDEPTHEQVREALLKAMSRPGAGAGEPRRPTSVVTDDEALVEPLRFGLNPLDVRCSTGPVPELEDAFGALEHYMAGEYEPIPGLLDHPNVTPEQVGELFRAAAEFYEVAPWEWMLDEDIVAVRYPVPDGEWRFASVMGNAGMEFGLAVFAEPFQYERLASIVPSEAFGMMEYRSLTYDEITALPMADVDAIERYDWDVVAGDAYPLPFVITKEEEIKRPGPEEIEWYTVVLQAVVEFYAEYWPEEWDYVPEPVSTTIVVRLGGDDVEVELRYPAELALER